MAHETPYELACNFTLPCGIGQTELPPERFFSCFQSLSSRPSSQGAGRKIPFFDPGAVAFIPLAPVAGSLRMAAP